MTIGGNKTLPLKTFVQSVSKFVCEGYQLPMNSANETNDETGPPTNIYFKVDDNPTRGIPVRCQGKSIRGIECTSMTRDTTGYCWRHRYQFNSSPKEAN